MADNNKAQPIRLKDNKGNIIYPVTHETLVICGDGETLADVLAKNKADIEGKADKTEYDKLETRVEETERKINEMSDHEDRLRDVEDLSALNRADINTLTGNYNELKETVDRVESNEDWQQKQVESLLADNARLHDEINKEMQLNKKQQFFIDAVYNANKDGLVQINSEDNITELPNSGNGMVEIKNIEGNTLVNRSNMKDETPVTKAYGEFEKLGFDLPSKAGHAEIEYIQGETMNNYAEGTQEATPVTEEYPKTTVNQTRLMNETPTSIRIAGLEGHTLVNAALDSDHSMGLSGEFEETGEKPSTLETGDNSLMDVEVKGKTIVNISNTNSDEYITHKFPDDQGIYMELEDSQDGFTEIQEIDGNTMVNRSKTKDITPITHKYDDMSNYGGEISGVEAIGNVEIGKMTGRTMVNLSAIELETPITVDLGTVNGNNSAILTGLQDNGSVNVGKIEGQTLVNLSNTEAATNVTPNFDPIIDGTITNLGETVEGGNIEIGYIEGRTAVNRSTIENEAQVSYKKDVENTDQIMLPDTSEGIARLGAIEGNTLVNLSETEENTVVTHDYGEFSDLNGKVVENIGENYIRLGNIEGETLVNVCDKQGFTKITNKTDMVDARVIAHPYGEDTDSRAVIEGSTLVNVCDQKDPVAVTKAYSVESGNHVTLQGEYDGKARPVVHGNTLVNLITPSKPSGYSVPSNVTKEKNKYTITCSEEGSSWLSVVFASNLFKPSTQYTLIFNIISNTLSTQFIALDSSVSNRISSVNKYVDLGATGLQVISFMSKDVIPGTMDVYMQTQNNTTGSITFEVIAVLEGDYTNKPIPGYFEGIKSSFEDNKAPDRNLLDGLTIITSDTYIKYYTVNVKSNTTYTLVNPSIINSDTVHAYGIFTGDSSTNILGYQSNSGIRKFNTGTNPSITVYCRLRNASDGSFNETSTLDVNWNQGLYLFEGDWTHLTMEDFEHLGKYKVEYKVTGKNKFDKNATMDGYIISQGKAEPNANASWFCTDYIRVDAGSYCIGEYKKPFDNFYCHFYDLNKNYIASGVDAGFRHSITTFNQSGYIRLSGMLEHKDMGQIVYSNQATAYEPYKEYTKTLYLNSPLLKEDTIEGIDGKVTHVHRYGKVILDGSEDENWTTDSTHSSNESRTTVRFKVNNLINSVNGEITYSDRFAFLSDNEQYYYQENKEGICATNDKISINILKSRISSQNPSGFTQWLSNNPITVVYKLASPIYETVSTDSILCDSYVNGNLDFTTNVPVKKVEFKPTPILSLKYTYPTLNYTVQFESDNAGKLDYIYLEQGSQQVNVNIVKGLNKFTLTQTNSTNYPCLYMSGIGFNASEISVVQTEREFNYFEGMSSSFESQLITDENDANYGKYKVEYRSIGKNKFDGQLIDGGFSTVTGVDTSDSDKKHSNLIKVKPNTSYTINSNFMVIAFYDHNKQFINTVYHSSKTTFTTPANCLYIKFRNYNSVTDWASVQIQLEEGNTATTYEPYKESIKTAYLNSPLLEGDKLEVINGKLCHVHNMKEIVLDGSEDENWGINERFSEGNYIACLNSSTTPDKKGGITNLVSDKLSTGNYAAIPVLKEGIWGENDNSVIYVAVSKSKLSSQDYNGFKLWLQSNPLKVVYQLANPWIEPLTTEDVTFKSFVNGHLSVESDVPVKLGYDGLKLGLKYLYPATPYTVKFISDKASIADIILGGTKLTNQNILAGENKFMMSTPDTLTDERLVINGTNANITDISVVNTVREYEHFEGIMNTYESEVLTNIVDNSAFNKSGSDEAKWTDNILTLKGNSSLAEGSLRLIINDNLNIFKPNTTYSFIYKVVESTTNNVPALFANGSTTLLSESIELSTKKGIHCGVFKTVSNFTNLRDGLYIHMGGSNATVDNTNKWSITDIMLFEGDLLDNYPTEYFSGSKYIANVTVCNNEFNFGSKGRI